MINQYLWDIYLTVTIYDYYRMNISKIRRENLRAVMVAGFRPKRGAQKRIAEVLGCQPDYASRCLSEPGRAQHKDIGEKLARDWEEKLGLSRYDLDDPDLPVRYGKPKLTLVQKSPEHSGADYCVINDKPAAPYRTQGLDRALLASIIRFIESSDEPSLKLLSAEQKAAAIAGAYSVSVDIGATADELNRHVISAACATVKDPNQRPP